MFGSAWFGVGLNSGGTTHAMKLLEEEEYPRFVEEFEKVPSAVTEGKLLHEQMRLKRRDVRIAVAWRHHSGARLREKGFGDTWQQKYLELPEFFGYVGSFLQFHRGVRFPLILPDCPEPGSPPKEIDPLEASRRYQCSWRPRSFEGAHVLCAPPYEGSVGAPKLCQPDS